MLERCPLSLEPEIWEAVKWWQDWENEKILPFGGHDRMQQPYFVYEAIELCKKVRSEALAEKAKLSK